MRYLYRCTFIKLGAMRLPIISFIASMALAIGASAHAQEGDTIDAYCKGVLSQFNDQIAENGLAVTENVQGGTVRMARGAYLDFLKTQVQGRANNCLRFVVQDVKVQSPHAPLSGG